jgi:hypothetical protein
LKSKTLVPDTDLRVRTKGELVITTKLEREDGSLVEVALTIFLGT